MEDLSKQKPMSIRLFAIQCHQRQFIISTALMVILLLLNGCYGDQIERDQSDIDTSSTSQVQFKKHHQRQAFNFNLTLHDNRLLRDETIKSDDKATTAKASSSSSSPTAVAQLLINKSDGSVKSNDRTTTEAAAASAVKTTTNYRFKPKRDQHGRVHQSRNLNGNAPDRKQFIQYHHEFKDTSNAWHRERHEPFYQPLQSVPHSKPKIIPKLSTASTYQRTNTYLSYNLVPDNVQKTRERFMPTTGQQPIYSTQIKQTNKNDISKSSYRPIQRNNCNKCRIIPGVPRRHRPYFPTKVRYHGMYLKLDISTHKKKDAKNNNKLII